MNKKIENRNGKVWQRVISLVPIIISLLSLCIAYYVWNDNRRLSGLDLTPEIRLVSHLQKTPPEFTIYNNGPVEALQLEVDQLWHMYKNGTIGVSSSLGEHKYVSPKLGTHERITANFDQATLYNSGLGLEVPKQSNIIEVRVTYRRPSDKQIFQKSALFLNNPAGRLVQEDDASLLPTAEFYQHIIKATLQRIKETGPSMPWDNLHSFELDK